uniref:Glutathione transferase n=1 Tax=Phanerodontia chrysosporium TaxID=2822231 RepID=A0A067XG72_PHACH|nr:Chain A, Glutathione transferase [Phanerodontia chrysosporium]4LMV_B Chain B, Glutathione transferase [Phanerodontia chrysosporium]4LMV_C Chain C, Glutathione transferase [Phanerodontia chrysosporium]4LMV_D Chain D, Glutathione transferase [Phanerodontia chrysosporium]4LMV_E Chain E, Glutathione transferase [Phanerodontia chrysosporium]4LMV_F Chain F, Glutathione transferase [Phanerodontia chrysosporium]
SQPIVFYDIPSNDTLKQSPWSPNTWKIRYALNIKGIKYKTEWVEYPDIEDVVKKLGGKPTGKKPDGRDHYTVPVIYDPNTKTVVEDGIKIAKYLDDAYPDTPRLFPAGTDAFQAAFDDFVWSVTLAFPLLSLLLLDVSNSLPPRSSAYFRATREQQFGKRLEEQGGEERWQQLEAGLGKFKGYLERNGAGNDLLLMGTQGGITYSDVQIASLFVWAKVVWGEGSEKWKRLMGFHGGKWAQFCAQFAEYERAD